MNKTINRPKAGLIIYQNAGQSDRSFWFFVQTDLLRKVTEICEMSLTNGWSDKEVFEGVWELLYNYEDNGYNPDIIKLSSTDPWALHGQRDLPFDKYDIVGMIPIKQVF